MPGELGRLLMEPITAKFLAVHPQVELDLALADRRADVKCGTSPLPEGVPMKAPAADVPA